MSAGAVGCTLVLLGATGDLATRKLYPAIWRLWQERLLPEPFTLVGVGRRDLGDTGLRQMVYASIRGAAGVEPEAPEWEALARRVFYARIDLGGPEGYRALARWLEGVGAETAGPEGRIFYLAVAPDLVPPVIHHLEAAGLTRVPPPGWVRVIIEKPFGKDLHSARELNDRLQAVFREEQIYRIDHYLGKEMVQSISVLRLANSLFEPLWHRQWVDNVQITVSEQAGVAERGGYYDETGAVRDMLQNHLLQMLALTAMDPPARFTADAIRDEKARVLRSLRPLAEVDLEQVAVRGQYGPGRVGGQAVAGYRQEPRVRPDSPTETYVALKAYVDNLRWAGVPFYLRTGKRLPVKATEISLQFRPLPRVPGLSGLGPVQPNRLVIRVDPLEGVYLQINAKEPGNTLRAVPVALDFCQNCAAGPGTPAAYERLLLDAIRGDPTHFTRWDEVALAWEYVDPLVAAWAEQPAGFPNYRAGSWGPEAARRLPERDGREWWPPLIPGAREAFQAGAALQAGAGEPAATPPEPDAGGRWEPRLARAARTAGDAGAGAESLAESRWLTDGGAPTAAGTDGTPLAGETPTGGG